MRADAQVVRSVLHEGGPGVGGSGSGGSHPGDVAVAGTMQAEETANLCITSMRDSLRLQNSARERSAQIAKTPAKIEMCLKGVQPTQREYGAGTCLLASAEREIRPPEDLTFSIGK